MYFSFLPNENKVFPDTESARPNEAIQQLYYRSVCLHSKLHQPLRTQNTRISTLHLQNCTCSPFNIIVISLYTWCAGAQHLAWSPSHELVARNEGAPDGKASLPSRSRPVLGLRVTGDPHPNFKRPLLSERKSPGGSGWENTATSAKLRTPKSKRIGKVKVCG